MSEIKDDVVMSESEKQEQVLREEFRLKKRKARIRKLVTWIVVIALLVAAGSAYLSYKKENAAKLAEMQKTTVTREAHVTENVYTATIDLSGYVEALETQTAKFRSTGAVTGVFVKEGDSVKKGTLLATIDNTSQAATVQEIKNQIKSAELSGSASELELLKLRLQTAENNLEYTNLIASFDGTIAKVDVNQGDYFEAGSSVMTLVDTSSLKATVQIDEIDMQYIELGQTAYLTFDSLPGEIVQARVTYIPMLGEYTTDKGIGIVEVELTIDNPPASLKPGYSFEGTISVDGDVKMLLIPQNAITTGRGGVTTVQRKLADGTTETVTVKVKYLGEGYCQLLSGNLEVGDTLVYEASASSSFAMGPMGPMM